MEKLDLTKKYKSYFTAKNKPEIVEIEKAQFLSITGKGDPSSPAFLERIQAIYPLAYALKFFYKEKGKDFVVSKLEGLWWFDESKYKGFSMSEAPAKIPRSEWEYRLLVRMPDFVNEKTVREMKVQVIAKKNNAMISEVHLFQMQEGKCVQMLHVGPFSTEPESLLKLKDFCDQHRFEKNGLHHEIYLSDFNKTAPEKLKTILREPVK